MRPAIGVFLGVVLFAGLYTATRSASPSPAARAPIVERPAKPKPVARPRPRPSQGAVRRAPLPPRPRHLPAAVLKAITTYRAVPLVAADARHAQAADLIAAKQAALAELEGTLQPHLDSTDGRLATEARLTLSSLQEDLGHALVAERAPASFGPDQSLIFSEQMEELSDDWFDKALTTAERAAETSAAFGDDPIRGLIDDRIQFLSDR